jgi:anti-sigma regulatory factor (Ser/Thr protein kinase)
VVRQAISGVADAEAWPAHFLTDVKIAVSEACSNVVVHAYPDGNGAITLRLALDDDRVVVEVADQGVGIAPRLHDRSAGLGLGLPLIAALSSDVRVQTSKEGHTNITMVLVNSSPEGPNES